MAHDPILISIERFLADTGMSASYFGEKAVRNSKVVARLRGGRPIQDDTAARLRAFMASEMAVRKAAARRLLRKTDAYSDPQSSAAPSNLPQTTAAGA
jgi:hypothetical protein